MWQNHHTLCRGLHTDVCKPPKDCARQKEFDAKISCRKDDDRE